MRRFIVIVAILLVANAGHAAIIDWTDWTESDFESVQGTVAGVGVNFIGALKFVQLASGNMLGSGASATTDYWIEKDPPPYTGNPIVDNRPPGFELIAFDLASQGNVIEFDRAVLDPVMAIVSMGQPGIEVSYAFDQPFTFLSEGRGFWGDGTHSIIGNTLFGRELHGVIQFEGLIKSIGWNSSAENWHGFTVGVPHSSQAPIPGTMLLLGAGLAGLAASRRRR